MKNFLVALSSIVLACGLITANASPVSCMVHQFEKWGASNTLNGKSQRLTIAGKKVMGEMGWTSIVTYGWGVRAKNSIKVMEYASMAARHCGCTAITYCSPAKGCDVGGLCGIL